MLRRFFCISVMLVLIVGATGANCQVGSKPSPRPESLPPDAATTAQVMTLLDLLQARRNVVLMMDNMKAAMVTGAQDSFKEKVPNATPQQLDGIRQIVEASFDEFPVDDLLKAVVPIYQRHLSKTDVEEIIRFYSSPAGQKLLHEQPQIIQESMQAGLEVGRSHSEQIRLKVEKKVQELADQEEKAGAARSK